MSAKQEEQKKEQYPLGYLPPKVRSLFREGLSCYRQDLQQAFAAMCRLTVQATIDDLGEGSNLTVFDQVEEVAELAGIDDFVYRDIRDVLFDTGNNSLHFTDGMDRETAVILLETVKEILHQAYIRRALLRKKLRMRRYFAAQTDQDADDILDDPKIAPIKATNSID